MLKKGKFAMIVNMLGSIKGTIIWKGEKHLLVENNGLGYKVYADATTLSGAEIGREIQLFLHTHVREDAFDLYGFGNMTELAFFELLLGVSGIGPKGALGILSVASVDTLKRSIKSGDIAYLTKISGIGKKTAEKISLELRDKIGNLESDDSSTDELDVLEALKALGYREGDVREALRTMDNQLPTNEKIREALKLLSKK